MKIRNILTKTAALAVIAVAAISFVPPVQLPLHAEQKQKRDATWQFPLFSAAGKAQARLHLECPSDPYLVQMVFEVFAPVAGAQVSDNPLGQCAKYALVSRHDCKVEIKGGEAASYGIDFVNLQGGDYLIKAGIILVGSGKLPDRPRLSLEITSENGASQILGPYLGGPQPDPPGLQ